MLFKNVSPVPVDVAGRMVAPGETADLDPAAASEQASLGHLLEVAVPVVVAGEPGPEIVPLPKGARVVSLPAQRPAKEN